jgi:hypothetical protein
MRRSTFASSARHCRQHRQVGARREKGALRADTQRKASAALAGWDRARVCGSVCGRRGSGRTLPRSTDRPCSPSNTSAEEKPSVLEMMQRMICGRWGVCDL